MTRARDHAVGDAGWCGRPLPEPDRGRERFRAPPDAPWPAIGVGISVAAGIYPCALALPSLLVVGVGTMLYGGSPSLHDALEGLVTAAALAVFASGFAVIGTAVVCAPTLFAAWGAIKLLGIRVSWTAAGAFSGGLVGFAYFAPICYLLVRDLMANIENSMTLTMIVQIVVATLLGPMLAIFVGQVGGAYGGIGVERQREAMGLGVVCNQQGRLSFSIRQLLGLTMVVSLIFAILRLAGLLNAVTVVVAASWLGWQTVSRRTAIALARRLHRNRPQDGFLKMPATPTSGAPERPVAGG